MQIRNQPFFFPQDNLLTGVSAAQRAQTAGAAFSKLVRSLSGAEQGERLVPKEEVQEVWSPQAIYQSMAMQVPAPTATSRTLRGICWTDQTLAVFIGSGGQLPIDTNKTIRWESEGEQTLTPAQAQTLSVRYPLDGISAQEYYDLLSELTHLGVLSAADCVGLHLSEGLRFDPESGRLSGNLLHELEDSLARMRENWALIQSEEYRQAQLFDEEAREEYRRNLEQDIHAREQLLALLRQF